jgi:hypothetical protein
MNIYQLDPAHYISAPSLSWDAMLKLTKVKIELFTKENENMYYFVEKGVRGGISMISNKYGKANNQYMSDYDQSKPSTYLQYLDANNLYGWSMSQYLPTCNYKWESENDFNETSILSLNDNDEKGYIFEVDLEYPNELHDTHNDYPLCPENKLVEERMLSPYQKQMMKELGITKDTCKKLLCDLTDKYNYIIHYRYLKLCIQLGLKLKKVHKVLSFNQTPFLKDYIMKNTNERQKAKNKFETEFFKLMNNSVFGKTMESVRKRCNIELVINDIRALKCVNNPNYLSHTIFNEGLVAVHKRKTKIKFDKPMIIGMSILDLSKVLMADFWYNNLKKNYGDKIRLLFTDTDSLMFCVETEDLYKDMEKFKDEYDLSEYPKKHPLYNTTNDKVIGKMKDECKGKIVKEFVGLASKSYSILLDDEEKIRCKGVKKEVVKQNINHNNYVKCLFGTTTNEKKIYHSMNLFRTKLHEVYSTKVNKVSLCNFNNKRYEIDSVNCLSYGNQRINLFN